jgi:hypothetical protein
MKDHVHDFKVKDYEPPQVNFIDIDTTKDSPDSVFFKVDK